jgi:hypothetical protein
MVEQAISGAHSDTERGREDRGPQWLHARELGVNLHVCMFCVLGVNLHVCMFCVLTRVRLGSSRQTSSAGRPGASMPSLSLFRARGSSTRVRIQHHGPRSVQELRQNVEPQVHRTCIIAGASMRAAPEIRPETPHCKSETLGRARTRDVSATDITVLARA